MNNLVKLISLKEISDEGTLRIGQSGVHIPFLIKRFYIISNIEGNAVRGKHAHFKNTQALFLLRGKVTMLLSDGKISETVRMENEGQGILLEPMIWHEMSEFSSDTILMVVASEEFVEEDYIRDYKYFLALTKGTHDSNE